MACFVTSLAKAQVFRILDKNGNPINSAVVLISKAALVEAHGAQGDVVIDQVDKQFVPKVSSIQQGSTVVFPNSDNIRHHVYSFSEAKPFELKLYSDQERPKVTFDKSGVVTLGCNIHDGMIGYVVINDELQGFVTDESGQVSIDINNALSEQSQAITLRVWHPWMGDNLDAAELIELRLPVQESDIMLDVAPPAQEKKEKSRLEKRFNRLGA
ncbi:hypothetical protein BFR57_04610 [Idiomarina sp. MD25a]|nr:hypothetical protein BFR57_04610 [Idiomarina sp. MD25a]